MLYDIIGLYSNIYQVGHNSLLCPISSHHKYGKVTRECAFLQSRFQVGGLPDNPQFFHFLSVVHVIPFYFNIFKVGR